jgi:hypothetical protein
MYKLVYEHLSNSLKTVHVGFGLSRKESNKRRESGRGYNS